MQRSKAESLWRMEMEKNKSDYLIILIIWLHLE